MSLTRDQLRAARMLLHLRQDELAKLAGVGTATVKRFETGNDIRPVQAEAIVVALRKEGAILIDGPTPSDAPVGLGVALLPSDALPGSTRARTAAQAAQNAERVEADRIRREANRLAPPAARRRGRPKRPA